MVISKKLMGLIFIASCTSNSIFSMEQEKNSGSQNEQDNIIRSAAAAMQTRRLKRQDSSRNLHRPPPLLSTKGETTQFAKELFSSAPRSHPNSARQKQESKNDDSSPKTLNKLFEKLCIIEANQKELSRQQAHMQACISALIHLNEGTAISKSQKSSQRKNRRLSQQSGRKSEATPTLHITLTPPSQRGASIADSSPRTE